MEQEYRKIIKKLNSMEPDNAEAYHIATDKVYKCFICDIINDRFRDAKQVKKVALMLKNETFTKNERKNFIKK